MSGDPVMLTLAAVMVGHSYKQIKTSVSRETSFRVVVLLSTTLVVTLDYSRVMAIEAAIDCTRPPLNVHPKYCCLMPPLLDNVLLQGCKDIHGPEDLRRGVIHEKGNCYMECAMNATGLLTNEGLDQVKILLLIGSRLSSQPRLAQAFTNAVTVCFQSAPQCIVVNNSGSSIKGKHCSSTAADFIGCVNMHLFKNCLDEYWINNSNCHVLRKFIQACPVPT
ncbi:uncharacterized protein LOC129725414 [Wyeomyia smithii]|uniref:uncharacterized protein LOC129725414 n=1 Tax=Wyeomyia smithii TaxID=174621 RepID=UPI002467F989|nr:uncharacterized protein LOC129725414 [Wyeomyia smithii]